MLLSVREDFPQPWEELDPGLLGQRCRNVAQLDEGTEQCSSLWAEEDGLRCALHPTQRDTKATAAFGDRLMALLSISNGIMKKGASFISTQILCLASSALCTNQDSNGAT